MFLMTDDIVLDMREMDDDMEVRLQVGRFKCVPEAERSHGFVVAVARTFPNEPTALDESAIFEPSDVYNVRLYISHERRERLERVLLKVCFGVFAYAAYLFFNPGATVGFRILMSIARVSDGYALAMSDRVSVPFKTLDELRAMLPAFGAEGERGYEAARADLIEQFTLAARH